MTLTKILLALGAATTLTLAAPAFAQSRGEADPEQAKSPPSVKVSPEEKKAARAARKSAGAQAARTKAPLDADNKSLGVAKKATSAERAEAAKNRRAAASAAVKAGEIKSGEK